MTRTIHVFERTTHEAHEWVNDLAGRTGWTSERDVLRLLRVVLTKIRDHLLVDEMAQFAAQLPIVLRGMYYEGWQPKKTPIHERHAADFVASIEAKIIQSVERPHVTRRNRRCPRLPANRAARDVARTLTRANQPLRKRDSYGII